MYSISIPRFFFSSSSSVGKTRKKSFTFSFFSFSSYSLLLQCLLYPSRYINIQVKLELAPAYNKCECTHLLQYNRWCVLVGVGVILILPRKKVPVLMVIIILPTQLLSLLQLFILFFWGKRLERSLEELGFGIGAGAHSITLTAWLPCLVVFILSSYFFSRLVMKMMVMEKEKSTD